jgi:hypothetical protein
MRGRIDPRPSRYASTSACPVQSTGGTLGTSGLTARTFANLLCLQATDAVMHGLGEYWILARGMRGAIDAKPFLLLEVDEQETNVGIG